MSIDIITTTYSKNADKLKTCLSSVIEKTKYADYKWYLWANEPDEKLQKIIYDSMYLDGILLNDIIEPIYNDNNDGSFSSNNNETVLEGSGDYLLFLNDDVEPINEDWLLNMKNILDTDPSVGVVGALLMYPDKTTIQHCGVFFSHKTNNLPFHIFYRRPVAEVSEFISVPRYYQAVTGACLLMRRKDFEEINGFNLEYKYGFEDVQLCLDVKDKLKKRIVFCPQAQLIHYEGISDFSKKESHPNLNNNIEVFRKNCTGRYFNDLDFYLNDNKFLIYKYKLPAVENQKEEG